MDFEGQPTYNDWEELAVIVDNVERIVSDGENRLMSLLRGGLLGDPVPVASSPNRRSVLSYDILNARQAPKADLERIMRVLPGADDLGVSRSQRIARLTGRMSEIKAFAWLNGHSEFGDAIRTVDRLAQHGGAYAKDTRLFLLLGVVIKPLRILIIRKTEQRPPMYPTKLEFEKAYRQTLALGKFIDTHKPIYGLVNVPIALEDSIAEFAVALKIALPTYRKPKNDGLLIEREYRDRLIQLLFSSFGECSRTILGHLLALVGYAPDQSDLAKILKAKTEVRAARGRALLVKALREGDIRKN